MSLSLSTDEVIDAVRADLAERRAAMFEGRWLDSRSEIDWRDRELERLHGVVAQQLSELARLQSRISELESQGRALALEQLIAAFAKAADRASVALEGQTIARLQAELRAVLQIADHNPGLIAATPEIGEGDPISTISFDLVPRPAGLADASVQEVGFATSLRRLQESVDRPFPASAREATGALLTAVTTLLAAAPAPPTRAELTPLVTALRRLAQVLSGLKDSIEQVEAIHENLDETPGRSQIENFAAALVGVTRQLEAMAPMDRGWIHTVHREGAWFNEIEDEGRLPTAHLTKKAAVAAGRELAKARHTEHVIHKLDGTIGERNSYGHDPFPPRG